MAKIPKAITDMSTLSRVIFDPDTTPPSVPSNVVGIPFSSTRIDLAWTASVDTGGSGMAGYLLFRNGAQIATPSAPGFSDTGLTASTTYQYRVAAVDAAGNISGQSPLIAVTTQANVGPPLYAPVQPAVAFVGIAGVRTYTDPTQQAAIGRYNVFVMGASWEGWAASGRDLDVIVKAIKAASTAQSGTLLFNYQNLNAVEEDANDPYPTWTAEVATRNWRLYVNGSSAPLVNPNSGAGATALVNYTTFVPQNPSLEYPYDFGAKYSYYKFLSKTKSDARFSALAAGLASTSLDGVYQDNFLANPQVNGDWNRDGVTEGQGWPSTETVWLQAGQLRYCTTMRALAPTKYIFVNGGDYGLVIPGVMGQQADGMLAESYMGKYWSWETQRGFVTVLGYYYKVLAAAANPHLVVFGGSWPDTNPDGSALVRLPAANGYPPLNTQWQWARYIAATALLGEGMHGINRLSQGYSSDLAALDWYDFEGGVNGLARGWLGAPVDALRPTTPKIAKGAIGIYGVEYQNGIVLVNPAANGTQTVANTDIPGNWKFLPGTQDTARDTGAVFSSVALPERDGLFLQRYTPVTGTIYLQEDYTGYPAGNITSISSALSAKGYINATFTNSTDLRIIGRAGLPAGLLSSANFPSGKTQVCCFTLAALEDEARLTWAGFPNSTTRDVSWSWWEYRDNNNNGGEKFNRVGNYVSAAIGTSRGIDAIIGMGLPVGTLTLFANSSAGMLQFPDKPFGVFNWPSGLHHFERVDHLPSDTSATYSCSLYIDGVLQATVSGIQIYANSTQAAVGWQLWDFGGWASGSGIFPIQRYICAARIASLRQGVWPIPAI